VGRPRGRNGDTVIRANATPDFEDRRRSPVATAPRIQAGTGGENRLGVAFSTRKDPTAFSSARRLNQSDRSTELANEPPVPAERVQAQQTATAPPELRRSLVFEQDAPIGSVRPEALAQPAPTASTRVHRDSPAFTRDIANGQPHCENESRPLKLRAVNNVHACLPPSLRI